MKKVKRIKKADDGLTLKMVGTNHRKYLEFNFEFNQGDKSITKKIIDRMDDEVLGDKIIQINIKIWEEDISKLDVDKIYDFLELKFPFYVRPIIPTIQRQKSLRNSEITADLKPEEAIKLFIKAMNPEDSDEIEEMALNIFRGVEV